jgi:hypothetical protein
MEAALADLIAMMSPRLEAMGFFLQHTSSFRTEFLFQGSILRIETEPTYSGLAASIQVADGQVFELGTLAEAINPDWYASYKQKSEEAGCKKLEMMLDFLGLHIDQIFRRHATFEGRYRELANARMTALGLTAT